MIPSAWIFIVVVFSPSLSFCKDYLTEWINAESRVDPNTTYLSYFSNDGSISCRKSENGRGEDNETTSKLSTNLRCLCLENSRLISFESVPLDDAIEFEILSLASNKITSLDDLSGTNFANLLVLSLADNDINNLTPENMVYMPKLKVLLLQNNSLTYIPSDVFQNNLELKYLDLSNNNIGDIGEQAFDKLRFLETLLLHNNRLRKPNIEWFRSILKKSYFAVDITENEWKCDCDTVYYMKSLQEMKMIEERVRNSSLNVRNLQISCSFPSGTPLNKNTIEVISKSQKCRNGSTSNTTLVPSRTFSLIDTPTPHSLTFSLEKTIGVNTTPIISNSSGILPLSNSSTLLSQTSSSNKTGISTSGNSEPESSDTYELPIFITVGLAVSLLALCFMLGCIFRQTTKTMHETGSVSETSRETRELILVSVKSPRPRMRNVAIVCRHDTTENTRRNETAVTAV